jgi:ORF6N domain-containing protein
MVADPSLVPAERVQSLIYMIRGQKVLLDRDLAALYGVETRVLNQAVRRNRDRFPEDFMFALTRPDIMRISQTVISSKLRFSKNVFVFTEQGVAMLSSVLKSQRAIQVNIEIMRAFVRLRQLLTSNAELARKLAGLERKYDRKFKIVFDAIRELMSERLPTRSVAGREIGFHTIPRLRAPRIKAKKF